MNILLIHGSGHNQSCWNLLVPHLEDRGFHVRALTLGACGDDQSEGELVRDCDVCCRPRSLQVSRGLDGELLVEANRAQ